MNDMVRFQFRGQTIDLIVERNFRAKRIRLKINRKEGKPVLVLPRRVTEKAGLDFAYRKADWILEQLAKLPPKKEFADGVPLSFLGQELVIHHSPQARRGVWIENNVIWVSGKAEHLSRRVFDFFKKEFRSYAQSKAREIGTRLDVKTGKITVRDTTSRWGSCNRFGDISLSWRLGLAPLYVLDYVIAHEAAHLREMNHSADFWHVVASVCPGYKLAELWLKRNTAYLHSFSV